MFAKLLKHEIKTTSRIIPFIYLSTFLLLFICYISKQFNIGSITVISTILTVIGIVISVIMTLVVIVTRFNQSMFKAEGYLSNTLPVSTNQLIFSKALVSFIWLILSYIFAFVCTILLIGIFMTQNEFNAIIQTIFQSSSTKMFWQFVFLFITISIIESIVFIGLVYFSITLGNVGKFQRMGAGISFVIFIVVYFAANIINTFITMFVPFGIEIQESGMSFAFKPMVTEMINMTSDTINTNLNITIGMGGYIFDIILIVGLFFLTSYFAQKKTNVK